MIEPLSIADVVAIMLPRGCDDGLILMLSGYFDDSGTHDGAALVAVGGFVGTQDQWAKLEKSWREKLLRPFPGFSLF